MNGLFIYVCLYVRLYIPYFVIYVKKNCMTEASFRLNRLMLRMLRIYSEGEEINFKNLCHRHSISTLVSFIEGFFPCT